MTHTFLERSELVPVIVTCVEKGENKEIVNRTSVKELVKRKYETECHIAAKFNDRKMLEAKWKPILNYNLIDT